MVGKVQVSGICRWSYPFGGSAFNRTPGDLETATRALYDPTRMAHRLFLTRHVLFPSIRAQTDGNFTLTLLIGKGLPADYRTALEDMARDIPQVTIRAEPEGQNHGRLCRRIMREARNPDHEACAEFRIDDDDAVGVDFVEQVKRLYAITKQSHDDDGMFAIDFTRGFVMRTNENGCSFSPIAARFWAPGTVVYMPISEKKSILDFHHLRLWHRMPALMQPGDPMFIRGAHHDNDSDTTHIGRRMRSFRFDMDTLKPTLLERYNIDVDLLGSAWESESRAFLRTAADAGHG